MKPETASPEELGAWAVYLADQLDRVRLIADLGHGELLMTPEGFYLWEKPLEVYPWAWLRLPDEELRFAAGLLRLEHRRIEERASLKCDVIDAERAYLAVLEPDVENIRRRLESARAKLEQHRERYDLPLASC